MSDQDGGTEVLKPRLLPDEMAFLSAILLIAFALRIAMPVVFPTIYHPDELFQYLEQGHRVAFGYGVIPWEYRVGTRSWLLPGLLGTLMWLTAWLGGGATAYMAVINVVLSAISLSIVAIAFLWANRLAGLKAAVLAGAITAIWFELVYFSSKPLTEVVAASTLFTAAYLLCSSDRPSTRSQVASGVLLGLTLALRLQLAPVILVIAVAGCRTMVWERWLPVMAGSTVIIVLAGVLDWATWGYPFKSYWLGFKINLLEGKAESFGTSTWYGYIRGYILVWSGFLVPLVVLCLLGARLAPVLLLVPLVIIASHSLIGHKEPRFVFPALPFILTLATLGTAVVVEGIARAWPWLKRWQVTAAAFLFWGATSVVLGLGDRFRPNLGIRTAEIAGFADLRARESICAVGLVNTHWANTAGYTYLHRDIPIYLVPDERDWLAMYTAFNAALSPPDELLEEFGYRRRVCYAKNLCLFVRDGACQPRPEYAINQYLVRVNQ